MLLAEENIKPPVSATPVTRLRVITESRPADLLTPVSLYLKVRDRFPGSILLESADNQSGKNSRSFIAFDRIATITANENSVEAKFPGRKEEQFITRDPFNVLQEFVNAFTVDSSNAGSGLFGFTSYDAIQFVESGIGISRTEIPYFSFSLFRFVIEIDHLRDTMKIMQYVVNGESPAPVPDYLFTGTAGMVYPFCINGEERAFTTNEEFIENVVKAKAHCRRGDVFQVVLSRRFAQAFTGDDFNVYRALRMINPSPYLFYTDFGNFNLFGSSPEALLVTKNGSAESHPIAGTYRKTGDEILDKAAEERLIADEKENAEHVMLVDLARNDLSRFCTEVSVKEFRQVHHYSHVIHLVSKVQGRVNNSSVVERLKHVMPAGTLSGAPKVRAMQLIEEMENCPRGYYGGSIGTIGFDGSVNMAILIRTFMSRNSNLYYQAGAGIVIDSDPHKELNEVSHKLGALRSAMSAATKL